jgi:hypothetical protein
VPSQARRELAELDAVYRRAAELPESIRTPERCAEWQISPRPCYSTENAADWGGGALHSADVDHRKRGFEQADDRWGFEEADDYEYQELTGPPTSAPTEEPEETLVGNDPDRVVDVVVSTQAEVIAVRLSPHWRRSIDPRGLHSSVVAAANAATMRALARNAENNAENIDTAPPAEPVDGADESPLSTQDVQRLLDGVSVELGRFTERLSEIVDHPVQVQSSGQHVQGSGQRGQVLHLDIDAGWAARARYTEIESELLEVLRGLHESSTPRELAAGPTGSAISELMDLGRDPQRLMRRLGMPS